MYIRLRVSKEPYHVCFSLKGSKTQITDNTLIRNKKKKWKENEILSVSRTRVLIFSSSQQDRLLDFWSLKIFMHILVIPFSSIVIFF